jgi:hypothetical protein
LFVGLLVCAIVISGFSWAAPSASAQADTALGTAVPVSNADGVPVGSISVTEVVDPFTDFDPAYPPEAGGRFVVVYAAFDADAGERFDIEPWSIVLQDEDGYLWDQASVSLPEDALIPELSNQTLAPGSRITGIVGFVLPEGSVPARVFYQPESTRLVLLADVSDQLLPLVGDAVPIPDSQGGLGMVTVAEVTDPFEDLEPGQTPPEGARLVQATLVFENPGDGRFFVEPYGLLLRDANGDLWNTISVSRPDESEIFPDLTSLQLAPGDRISGVVAFAVPEDVGLGAIYATPESGRLLMLADLQEMTREELVAEFAPDVDRIVIDDSGLTDVSAEVSEGCSDLEVWLTSTRERIRAAGAMSVEDAALTDLQQLADHVDEYVALAEDQLADPAPPEAEAAGQALVATLNAYGASLEQILGAGEPGKDTMAELTEGMNTFNEAGARLQEIEQELMEIAATCGLT